MIEYFSFPPHHIRPVRQIIHQYSAGEQSLPSLRLTPVAALLLWLLLLLCWNLYQNFKLSIVSLALSREADFLQ